MPTITALGTATSVSSDDLVLIVNDPDGVAATQKARISDIIGLATTVLAGAAWKGGYAGGTTYVAGDVVSSGGSVYISLVGSNTGHTPASSPTQWQILVAQGPKGDDGDGIPGDDGPPGLPSSWNASLWSAGTYAKGTAVHHADGNSYVAVVDSATQDPSTHHGGGDNWRLISERGLTGAKPFTLPTVWTTGVVYTAGTSTTPASSVFHTDSSYVCLVNHTAGASFADDLALDRWQMIAAPGGLTGVETGGGGIVVDNTDPTLPLVKATTQVRTFRYDDVATGSGNESWGSFGGGDGIAGATFGANFDYATSAEVARITLSADSASTGDAAYERRIELEASITGVFTADSRVYYEWVRQADTSLVYPRITDLLVTEPDAQGGTHQKTTHIGAISPVVEAADDETFVLKAWIGSGAVIWNFTTGEAGNFDVLTAKAIPV